MKAGAWITRIMCKLYNRSKFSYLLIVILKTEVKKAEQNFMSWNQDLVQTKHSQYKAVDQLT